MATVDLLQEFLRASTVKFLLLLCSAHKSAILSFLPPPLVGWIYRKSSRPHKYSFQSVRIALITCSWDEILHLTSSGSANLLSYSSLVMNIYLSSILMAIQITNMYYSFCRSEARNWDSMHWPFNLQLYFSSESQMETVINVNLLHNPEYESKNPTIAQSST